MKNIDEKDFIKVCSESDTMAVAAATLGLHFTTFKKYAKKFGCYKPNQGGKGTSKEWIGSRAVPLQEILEGKHPAFQTYKLRNKLLKAKIFENRCSICGIRDWLGKKISCELDHIDGDRTNHRIENIRMLCPNCHSQTDTFRSKKRLTPPT